MPSINHEKGQVEMTLRSGDLKTLTGATSLSDFTIGQKVDGVVKKVEDYGVFVEIKGTKISGLCHKSELVDANGPSIVETLKLLRPGDSVRAVVLKVDCQRKKISFGLKPSYFFSDDLASSDENDNYIAGSAESESEEAEDEDMASNAGSSADEPTVCQYQRVVDPMLSFS
jgi:rRNA biogenesis protein RRP5